MSKLSILRPQGVSNSNTDPSNLIAESYTTISTIGGINPTSEIYLRVNDSGTIEII